MSPGDMALLAMKLSMLTFYIGVLIYALPVPSSFIKRWAPALIGDSLIAFLIALSYNILYSAADSLALMLGGSKTLFLDWYSQALSVSMFVKMVAAALESLPSRLAISPAIQAAIIPFDRVSTLAIIFLTTLAGIFDLVFTYGHYLLLFGLVLYAVPFRIGRDAGAWLISFILVFTVGLPVLPVFLQQVASPPPGAPQMESYKIISPQVLSSGGHPAGRGVLILTRGGEPVAIHELTYDGRPISGTLGEGRIALPAEPLIATLDYAAVLFPLAPEPVELRDLRGLRLELRAPHVLLFKDPLIAIYTTGREARLIAGEGWYVAVARLEPREQLSVTIPSACEYEIASNGTMAVERWRWRGVEGRLHYVTPAAAGVYAVNLSISRCEDVHLEPIQEKDYMVEVLNNLNYFSIDVMRAFIAYYLTIPAMYVFSLFLITTGLAALIGGRGRLPVRVA